MSDKLYEQAERAIVERLMDVEGFLGKAHQSFQARRPEECWEYLNQAKGALEGAMTTAKWAQSLPTPEEGR